MEGPEIYKSRTVSKMVGFWSESLSPNSQAPINPNLFQSPPNEENFFASSEPGQPQDSIFASTPSGSLDHVEHFYGPPAVVREITHKAQLCLNTPEGRDLYPQTLDPTQQRKAGILSSTSRSMRTPKRSTATNSVASHPATSSPPSKPKCPSCNRGFSRTSDLNRHFHQVHHRLRWNCHLGCGNNRGNGWSREDKWKEHIRREHPSFNLANLDTSARR